MKQGSLYETFIQLAALVFAFIVVQATYTTVIRPVAADIQAYQAEQQQVNEDFVPERSVFVILKDFEQQACITLMLWAVFIIGMKTQQTVRQRSLLERTLVQVKEGMSVLPEDSRNYARPVQALPEHEQAYLLPRALLAGLHRFQLSLIHI